MTPGNDDQIKYHSFNDNINNSNERYNQNKNKRYSLVEVDENNNIKKIIQEDYNPDNKNILRELNLNLIKLQQLEIESLNNIKRINSRVGNIEFVVLAVGILLLIILITIISSLFVMSLV